MRHQARRNSAKLLPGLITRNSLNDMVKLLKLERAEIAYRDRSRSQRKDVKTSKMQEQELIALRESVKTVSDEARVLLDQARSLGWNPSRIAERFSVTITRGQSLFIRRWQVVDMLWAITPEDYANVKRLASTMSRGEAMSRTALRRRIGRSPDVIEAVLWVIEPDLENADRMSELLQNMWYYNDSEARLRLLQSLEFILPDPAEVL